MWVICLKFLHNHSHTVMSRNGFKGTQPELYFTNYNEIVRVRGDEEDEEGSAAQKLMPGQQGADSEKNKLANSLKEAKKEKKKHLRMKKAKPMEKHKFNNIDAAAFSAIVHHNISISLMYDED